MQFKSFFRRLSLLTVVSLLLSTALPILAFAADIGAQFWYSRNQKQLSGSIYTRDPDQVSVTVNHSSSVTEITYSKLSMMGFDDNNKPIYFMYYFPEDISDELPSGITVMNSGTSYPLIQTTPSPDIVTFSSSGTSYILGDYYRMSGREWISSATSSISVTKSTYLPAGAKLFSFTPTQSESTAIQVNLPKKHDQEVSIVPSVLSATYFTLTDKTTNEVIKINGVFPRTGSGYSDSDPLTLKFIDAYDGFFLDLNSALIKDHEYELALSSESTGFEIQLPTNGSDYTAFLRLGQYDFYDHSLFGVFRFLKSKYRPDDLERAFSDTNLVAFKDITIGKVNTDAPPPPSGGSFIPAPTPPPVPEDQVVVSAEDLQKPGTNDQVSIELSNAKREVRLPIDTAELLDGQALAIRHDSYQVVIPNEVLQSIAKLLPAAEQEGASVAFRAESAPIARNTLGSGMSASGEVLDFTLSVTKKDGTVIPVANFTQPIRIGLKYDQRANPDLLGIYYIDDNNKSQYIGGTITDGKLYADVEHFSRYAVLSYNKSYQDVPSSHWAKNYIAALTAKHISDGTGEFEYSPDRAVTRAEFVALLSRVLGLEGGASAGFTDVPAEAWYANAVHAAVAAGLVTGRTATTFAPDEQIKREEMAVLIARAYSGAGAIGESLSSTYADESDISEWAAAAVQAVSKYGVMEGQEGNLFNPQAYATRAETSKVIYLLMSAPKSVKN